MEKRLLRVDRLSAGLVGTKKAVAEGKARVSKRKQGEKVMIMQRGELERIF